VAFQQGSSQFTLSQALAGAGYAGAVDTLASVYMAQYSPSGGPLTYLAPSNLVEDEGLFQTRPAKIRRLASSSFIQVTEGEEVALEAGPALLALASASAAHADQIELLDSGVAGLEASMQTKVEEEAFDAAVAALQGAIALKADQAALNLLGAEVDALGTQIEGEIAQLELDDEALQAALATKANQAALDEVFAGLQATSAQAASNGMNIQTLQAATSGLLVSVGELDARVTANAAANAATQGELELLAAQVSGLGPEVQADIAQLQAEILTKAPQSALNSTDQALAALTVEVAGKQDQLGVGFVEGGQSLLEGGVVKAILGAEPVQVTSTATHVEVSMAQSYFNMITSLADATAEKASTSELLGVKAIAESNNQALADLVPQVEDNSQALTTLGSQVAGKQDQLTDPNNKVVRAIKGVSPVQVAVDTNHVEVFIDQNALGAQSATGPVDTMSLVNAQGRVLRLLAGTSLYATSASPAGYVEVGLDPQNVQLRAPFSVRDETGVSLRARIDTKAQFFTAMEVVSGPPAGADLGVGGSIGATGNISKTASLLANSLVPYSGTTVTVPYDFAVEGTLTLAGQNVAAQLAVSEPKFTAVAPLQKVVNFQTGQLELRMDSPFFCAGRVNGISVVVGSSIGRVGYTVSRPSTHPTSGVIRITFDSPAPSNTYVVSLAPMYYGVARLLESPSPDVNGFSAVMSGNNWGLTNGIFHFSVTL
jgi:hypothetical protein